MQALLLMNDFYKYKMELATNEALVIDAIKYVQSQMEHPNNTEEELLEDIEEDRIKEEDIKEPKSLSGIF